MALVETEDRGDGVVVVNLNDPDRRNAMTSDMGAALRDTCTALAEDDGLRAVVLTGAGSAFSAGGDLSMLEEHARMAREEGFDATDDMAGFYELFLSVREVPIPVVAAVNGHAVGAGACVALACDLVVVAEDAKFGLNFVKVGIHPGMGGSWLVPHLAGSQRAAELLYTGRLVTGREAAAYGLALEALPADEVLPRGLELGGAVAASAPQPIRQLKRTLQTTWGRSLAEQLAVEAANQSENYRTADVAEGLAAARERRAPRFRGT